MELFGPPNVGKLRDRGDVAGLIKALSYKRESNNDDHVQVRKSAAWALGRIGESIALEPLIDALKDCRPVREAVVESLGWLGDSRAIDPLIAGLEDKEASFRKAAEDALFYFGESAIPQLITRLEGSFIRYPSVITVLGRIGNPRAVLPLIPFLEDGNRLCEPAVEALIYIGEPAVEPLIAALKDTPKVRGAAVRTLGELGDERAVAPLIKLLMEDDATILHFVADALVNIGPLTIEPLFDALTDENKNIRYNAADILDRLEWKPTTKEDQAQYWVAKRELEKCVTLGGAAVEALISAITSQDAELSQKATEVLENIGAEAVEPLLALFHTEGVDRRVAIAGILSQIGDVRAVEPMLNAMQTMTPNVRKAAIGALGKIGERNAIPSLVETLHDQNGELRIASAAALGHIGDSQAVEPLISLLHDQEDELKISAAEALGQIGDGNAVEPLIALLQDQNEKLRLSVFKALCKIKDTRVIEPMIAALHDPNDDLRICAAEALGQIGDGKAVEALIETLQSENENLRSSAVKTLGRIGDIRAVEPLIALLRDSSAVVRKEVVIALEACGWEPVAEHLAWYLAARQEWEKCAALGEPAAEPLINALKDVHQETRAGAARALGSLKDDRTVEKIGAELKVQKVEGFVSSAWDALLFIRTPKAIETFIADFSTNKRNIIWFIFALHMIKPDLYILPLIASYSNFINVFRWSIRDLFRDLVDKSGSVEDFINDNLKDKDGNTRNAAIAQLKEILSS